MTHSQLAAKFGWPSVIISAILLPVLLLWSKLLAFPVWIDCIFKNGPFYTMKYNISYPDNEDVYRRTIYEGPTPTTNKWLPSGWTGHLDYEGGKFFEAFWGIMQVADIDFNADRIIISSNSLTWLNVSNVFIEFPKAPVHEHQIRFYFPIWGITMLNPFCWVTSTYAVLGVLWFEKVANRRFAKENGIYPKLQFLPHAEDPAKIHLDGSMTYEPSTNDKEVGYGSMS